eukprot:3558196-Amphidinium_carterae.1
MSPRGIGVGVWGISLFLYGGAAHCWETAERLSVTQSTPLQHPCPTDSAPLFFDKLGVPSIPSEKQTPIDFQTGLDDASKFGTPNWASFFIRGVRAREGGGIITRHGQASCRDIGVSQSNNSPLLLARENTLGKSDAQTRERGRSEPKMTE